VVDVRVEAFYRVACSRCGEAPDADGEEFARTPEDAERVAGACDFRRVDGRMVCGDCLELVHAPAEEIIP
jgi:hypothetical protein